VKKIKKSKASTPMLICTKCWQRKPATREYFRIDRSSKTGFQSACKICAQKIVREHYQHYTAIDKAVRGKVGVHCILYAYAKCSVCMDLSACWRIAKLTPTGDSYPDKLKEQQ
jgi:hypothetical protein